MNGGYIIVKSPIVDELVDNIVNSKPSFSVSGVFSYSAQLFKLGKIPVIEVDDGHYHFFTTYELCHDKVNEQYIFTLVAVNRLVIVAIDNKDNCLAIYHNFIGG